MQQFIQNKSRYSFIAIALLTISFLFTSSRGFAQGVWVPLTNPAPDMNAGVMLLLSDGTVIVKTTSGSGCCGSVWDKLTPDSHGSYVNGTWSVISQMADDRLYFSSQVLKNGQVYVAGGEYGSGYGKAEVYNPITDIWTPVPPLTSADSFFDANSEILPDGKVMQSILPYYTSGNWNYVYDPASNTFSEGPPCLAPHDESTWVKLADGSILFVSDYSTFSQRYIPSLNAWVADATVPVMLYDSVAYETGPAVLLPDGRAFFMSGSGVTAIYTPSGTTSPGTWVQGPTMPAGQATPDAPATMMVDGNVLITTSLAPHDSDDFPSPMSFYVFDYLTDSFIHITAPDGNDTFSGPSFISHMLDLPDGSILFSSAESQQYYEYVPGGTPLAAGKPTIDTIINIDCTTYEVTGKLFNGITEGACYGDDWQMATNYPIIRFTADTNVYYGRTYNWNRTGVMTGSLPDTAMFTIPDGLPTGSYSVELVVNGNPSAPKAFITCPRAGVASNTGTAQDGIRAYPNPATTSTTVVFDSKYGGQFTVALMNMMGQVITEETATARRGKNNYSLHFDGIARGIYTIVVSQSDRYYKTKIVLE